jgi:phosphate butyryltransferase
MMVRDFADIEALVRSRCRRPRQAVVIGNCFTEWIHALKRALDAGLVRPLLIGNQVLIRESAEVHGLDVSGFDFVHVIGGATDTAIETLKTDSVDLFIRGDVGILDMLSALFRRESGFRVGRNIVSGISAHFVGALGRLLLLSDPVVIPAPDLRMKISIIRNAVEYSFRLGFVRPGVALTAAVEVIYPAMQHTVEAAVIAKMSDRRQIKGCVIDGPLSMDTAVIESAAEAKGVTGPVAGKADILVQPTIETSYGMYKAFVHYVKAPSGCIVTGGKVPVCVTSRADSVETNYNSLLMALV